MPPPRPRPAMNSLPDGRARRARSAAHARGHSWSQPRVTHMGTPDDRRSRDHACSYPGACGDTCERTQMAHVCVITHTHTRASGQATVPARAFRPILGKPGGNERMGRALAQQPGAATAPLL